MSLSTVLRLLPTIENQIDISADPDVGRPIPSASHGTSQRIDVDVEETVIQMGRGCSLTVGAMLMPHLSERLPRHERDRL